MAFVDHAPQQFGMFFAVFADDKESAGTFSRFRMSRMAGVIGIGPVVER
jgi:hypothetical protein